MKRFGLFALALLFACTEPWSHEGGIRTRWIDVKTRGVDVVPVFLAAPPTPATTGVVLAPGGFVEPERYEWLARRLAASGRAVAMPAFPLNLGILQADDVLVARRVLLEGHAPSSTPALAPEGRIVALGHSLGGVVAAGAVSEGDFASLVLLASYPSGGADVESFKGPALSVAGSLDCDTELEDARAGLARFGGPRLFAVIEGLTHYGFTDSYSDDRSQGCMPQLELELAHERIFTVIDLFLKANLDEDPEALRRLEEGLEDISLEAAP